MATESRDGLTKRDAGSGLAANLFGRDVPLTRRVIAGSSTALAGGAVVTGMVFLGENVAPHFATITDAVWNVGAPGLVGTAAAVGLSSIVNGLARLDAHDDDKRARRAGASISSQDMWTKSAMSTRESGTRLNRIVGVASLVIAGIASVSAAGLDVTGLVSAHGAADIGDVAQVFAGAGATALASAGLWHRSITRRAATASRALTE